jgi:heme A synthase
MAGQVLLLLLPINIAERRLPSRRPLQTPVIVTAFFLANLFLAGIVSILCAAFKEDGFYPFVFLSGNTANPSAWDFTAGAILTLLVFWLVWAAIFRRYAKSDEPDALLKRSTRWLLRGSILELLVAVPSHVIVRRREDCCAPIGTFWGIATGISVMLLCFGPGVFFLFVERFERLKPKSETDVN